MSSKEITNIIVGIAVVVFFIARQVRVRPLREVSGLRIVVVLGLLGLLEVAGTIKGQRLGASTIEWILGSLVMGALLGAARAFTVRIWRVEDGSAMRKGTNVTAVLWLVSLGAHFGLEVGIDDSTKIVGLGASSLLFYLAVTLGAQREVLRRRASTVPSPTTTGAGR